MGEEGGNRRERRGTEVEQEGEERAGRQRCVFPHTNGGQLPHRLAAVVTKVRVFLQRLVAVLAKLGAGGEGRRRGG